MFWRSVLEFLLVIVAKCLLFLRYRIEVRGKETLTADNLSKPGGILFLANHPAEIDPLILLSILWYPFKLHPVAIDYLFRKPFLRSLLELVGAIPVPNFEITSNSYKRKQVDKVFEQIYAHIDNKKNLLIYPAGLLKRGPKEEIGGASGVHKIVSNRPQANIVLVRSTGLWGSSFSRAITGKTPDLFAVFFNGLKVLLRNFIFFSPRRKVVVELSIPAEDFPWKAEKMEFNRYLEKWYNERGPEPLNLISYSFYKKDVPKVKETSPQEKIPLEKIPDEIKQGVLEEIANIGQVSTEEISPESHLAHDLGLDSLDIAQLVVALKERFGVTSLHSSDLTTVTSVFAYAAKMGVGKSEEPEVESQADIWEKEKDRPPGLYPEGDIIPEVFFNTCKRMKSHIACVDQIAHTVSYRRLKMGVLLIAQAIRKMPGERIGIMMPASVGVNATILAVMVAGKIPVMINWTLGERNLRSVVDQSGIQVALSSWHFIDRLDNVELNGIDDRMVLLEDVRRHFSLWQKGVAFYRSFQKPKRLLRKLGLDHIKSEDTAVILFTSGTESYPKGVPLSHYNLLSNQRGAYSLAKLQSNDVLLGALPPFHSFGFSVTGLLPLLTGMPVVYSPNPTDGKRIAEAIQRWEITLLCLAPTFLKNLLRVANDKQLRSLRLVVAGAEKTAAELYDKLQELNPETILVEGYGITECAPILTLNPPDQPGSGVGIPLPDVALAIVDADTMAPLEKEEQGLILARGPNVFQGYLDPNLPSPFVEFEGKMWYQTGDIGYLDENRFLILTGRSKRFIKIGGEMVSLTAIEETLHDGGSKKGWKIDPDVPSLAVCALESEGKKSEIHLFTIFQVTPEEANAVLRESGMSNIIKIRSVKTIPHIPLLGSGKIDYRQLTSKLTS